MLESAHVGAKEKYYGDFRFPADEFRALPIPYTNPDSTHPKVGSCFVRCTDLPADMQNWLKVNPRVTKKSKKDDLVGPVAKGIINTLTEDPATMALKNNGITRLVSKMSFEKEAGGKGYVVVELTDPVAHGVGNGGHTLAAIRQVIENEDGPSSDAFVRLHVYENLDPSIIPEIAEGLNRSLQVDAASLENLQGTFDEIKDALDSHTGADKVAYRQGDNKPVDVQFILTIMAMMDIDQFPDRKHIPQGLFGKPKAILNKFAQETKDASAGYKKMLPQLHEILAFSDRVQRAIAQEMGQYKVKDVKVGTDSRVASARHKKEPAYFDGA